MRQLTKKIMQMQYCLLSVFLFLAVLVFPTSCNVNVAMFVFGDSFFDPGNNNYINVNISFQANFWPYGETSFKFPTGRFSDGPLIPDFIAIKANLPLWRPYLQPGIHDFSNGANFASGGSGILDETNPGTISLRMQLSSFKMVASLLRQTLGDAKAQEIITKAVYMFSTGSNDIGQFLVAHPDNATELEKKTFLNIVMGNLTDVIKEIYEIGGRKFAIQNATPMGCLPVVRQDYYLSGSKCAEFALYIARLFNSALYEVAPRLESELAGLKYSIFDFYSELLNRIKDPPKYGFKVGISACCGAGTYNGSDCGLGKFALCSNPNEYVYFDGCHQTGHVYSQLAELWWHGEREIAAPYNMKKLFQLESAIAIQISSKDFGVLADE